MIGLLRVQHKSYFYLSQEAEIFREPPLYFCKNVSEADFLNLPSGLIYSDFADFPKFQVAIKMPSRQISKIGL